MNGDSDAGAPGALPPDDPALLDRYLTGECSAEEAARVRRWLAEDRAHHGVLAQVREVREAISETPVWDAKGMWAQLSRGLLAGNASPVGGQVEPPRLWVHPAAARRSWRRAAALAASVAVVVGGGATLVKLAHAPTEAVAMREFSTRAGQRAELSLPDGSTVMLAPQSTVRYPDAWGSRSRDVSLQGEAVFTVAKRDGVPFTVYAAGRTARVLGTTFLVRHYAGDHEMRVAVAEGKVQVGRSVLTAGTVGEAMPDGEVAVARRDVASLFAWTTGQLVFENAALGELLAAIRRWYGLDVRVTDSTRVPPRYTVTFEHEDAAGVVEVLALLTHTRPVRAGETVILQPVGVR